jgi:WHEP-TRS domain
MIRRQRLHTVNEQRPPSFPQRSVIVLLKGGKVPTMMIVMTLVARFLVSSSSAFMTPKAKVTLCRYIGTISSIGDSIDHLMPHRTTTKVVRWNDHQPMKHVRMAHFTSFKSYHSTSFSATTTAATEGQENATNNSDELEARIKAKGDEIRSLKESGADKAQVAPLVADLLALKQQLEGQNTSETPAVAGSSPTPSKQPQPDHDSSDDTSGHALSDSITPRADDYSKWYNDIIRVTGLAETSPVRGCMVIKPWGMSIWDRIRNELDQVIQDHGAENAYFPLLIPRSFLSKEVRQSSVFYLSLFS